MASFAIRERIANEAVASFALRANGQVKAAGRSRRSVTGEAYDLFSVVGGARVDVYCLRTWLGHSLVR